MAPLGNLNNLRNKVKNRATREDLDQIINIHANKQSVGAKKHDKYVNSQITESQKMKQSSLEEDLT